MTAAFWILETMRPGVGQARDAAPALVEPETREAIVLLSAKRLQGHGQVNFLNIRT